MIKISQNVYDDMVAHAREGMPLEICGYLGKKDSRVILGRRMKNIDASREHFTLDPAEQFAVLREFRNSGVEIAAVYHSHPETPARPSREDIRLAHDEKISYIIISMAEKTPMVKSFLITKGQVAEEPIEVVS
ncbi:MAG: M67 family metallopeptidase [Fibrobacterota bacterium]